MAESLGLLDDAVRLLRRTSPATLVCHWIGSAPFALGLLMAWNTLTSTHTTDAAWAGNALTLTLLLVWMNCWRSAYAGRLRLELSGTAGRPWTLARAANLAAAQAFFGATKLVALPLAGLVMFPWAETVAFCRYLHVLSVRDDLTLRQMLARARHLATLQRRTGWTILPILLFLQLAIALNLAIVVGMLPQLVRILTGYETVYSRSGIYFVANPMFLLLLAALCWMTFDPFVQAVYTVRCFQAESIETGEDLRSGLRRLRAAVPALAALALLLATVRPARATIPPEQLQQSIRQTMQAPEYDWRFPASRAADSMPWVVRIADRLVDAGRSVLHAVGGTIDRFFRWLGDKLRSARLRPGSGGPPVAGLSWIVALLIAIALAATAAIVWQRRRSRATPRTPAVPAAIRVDAADLTPDLLPEESWIELADRSLAEGNFRYALRALYLASLAWLGRRQYVTIHAGKTDREYEIELRRRTRALPRVHALFAANVAVFARVWYGLHETSAHDAAQLRERFETLKGLLAPPMGTAL